MAGTEVLGRLSWLTGEVVALHDETTTARTLALVVPNWPGHIAGQHIDLRLTAPDGYSAVRSYSIASAPTQDQRIEITVERLENGEVSPYLTQEVTIGDELELRGPIGRWFVWHVDQTEPIQLIAGGSGIVPLMAMIRSRLASESGARFRLLYSVREQAAGFYKNEFRAISNGGDSVILTYAFTRITPKDWPRAPGRIDAALVSENVWPSDLDPTCYVCGPTSFVEHVSGLLIMAGLNRERIRTERFGSTGEHK
jgi:ferredoxin-NADP reductase